MPFVSDLWGDAFCGEDFDEPTHPYGCAYPQATTEAECTAAGYKWISSWTEAECKAAPNMCFDDEKYNFKSEADCSLCKEKFGPVFKWAPGVWTPGKMVELDWTTREFAPIRKIDLTLDYVGFGAELEKAVVASKSLSFSTEAYCKYSALVDAMSNIACDCNGGSGSGCYEGSRVGERQVGVGRACPFVQSEIKVRCTTPFRCILLTLVDRVCAPLDSCELLEPGRVLSEPGVVRAPSEHLPAQRRQQAQL